MTPPAPDYTGLSARRSKRWQPLRHALEYALVRAILALAAWIPVRTCQRLGSAMGAALYSLPSSHRRIAEVQLALAFPELDAAARRRLGRTCFRHLGMTAWEALALPRLRREARRWIRLEGEEVLRAAYAEGRGVVLLTGHVGNWELLSIVFDLVALPARAVVRTLVNRRVSDLLVRHRNATHLGVIQRGAPDAPRQLLACLKGGEALVLAIDQDIRGQGVFADFFGVPANTPRVAASLALRLGAPVVTAFDARGPDGVHTFRFERLPPPPGISDDAAGVRAFTQTFNDAIERHVRAHPEQWAWNHRRWKRRPPPEA